MVPEKVVLHPLVLLSVVDHYNRVAKDTKKRIVGVLLGETYKGQVDVTNSFAGEVARTHKSEQCLQHSIALYCMFCSSDLTTELPVCLLRGYFVAGC